MVDYWRQLGILAPNELEEISVTLIGAGGIGSPTAQLLVKMGVSKLSVFDYDKVELHNIPNQIYRLSDINKPKVVALSEMCKEISGVTIEVHNEAFSNQHISGVVISAVDTMQTRIDIWKRIKYNPNVRFYIDARMGAEISRVHTVRPCDPDEIAHYEKNLYTDEQATEDPCTARAIIYNVFQSASVIANIVKRLAKGDPIPMDLYFDFVNLMLISGRMDQGRIA